MKTLALFSPIHLYRVFHFSHFGVLWGQDALNSNPAGIDSDHTFQGTIKSDPAEVRVVQDHLESLLGLVAVGGRDSFCVKLGMEEALVNAVKHGNQMDHSKTVTVFMRINPIQFEAKITDQGPGFNLEDIPDPTDIENLERPCGRGLMLIRHYMHEVTHNETGNSVHMVRRFNQPEE